MIELEYLFKTVNVELSQQKNIQDLPSLNPATSPYSVGCLTTPIAMKYRTPSSLVLIPCTDFCRSPVALEQSTKPFKICTCLSFNLGVLTGSFRFLLFTQCRLTLGWHNFPFSKPTVHFLVSVPSLMLVSLPRISFYLSSQRVLLTLETQQGTPL